MTRRIRQLKIAFVGSHGVGKTTVVDQVAKELKLGAGNVIRETASRVFEMGKTNPALKINQGATLEAQLHIIGIQIQEEMDKYAKLRDLTAEETAENKYSGVLLCDRTPFDAVVYTHYRVRVDDTYPWAGNFAKHLYEWASEAILHPYDLVFYIPISFPLMSNDVRPADLDFQEAIDVLMQDVYLQHKLDGRALSLDAIIKKTAVLSGSLDRRAAVVKAKIDELMKEEDRDALARSAYSILAEAPTGVLQNALGNSLGSHLALANTQAAKLS